ncbi:MAG: hypothetical protein MJ106_03995, partial [Lentisphaeria bacterium]|nr:hypothetical protein [Lentisphaeria bacterium]
VASLITYKGDFNLDKMLHRGEYNLEHVVSDTADKSVAKEGFSWLKIAGITPEYSKGDRILAWSVLIYTCYNFLFFLVELIWNVIPGAAWSEDTWFYVFLYYTLPLDITIGIVTTIWFTWGSSRDLVRLIKALKENYEKPITAAEAADNGQILTK